jgi:hypothetical protein
MTCMYPPPHMTCMYPPPPLCQDIMLKLLDRIGGGKRKANIPQK